MTNLNVSILRDFKEQQRKLEFLVMGHGSSNVHMIAHDLRVNKINIALFEFFDVQPLLDQLK